MTSAELQYRFNRALQHAFDRKKLLFVASVLAVCGLLVVFCRALAIEAGAWVQMSLAFLPIFLCSGVALAMGILLARLYHNEIKGQRIPYSYLLASSWDVMVRATYFSIPIILCYLVLWLVLGVFTLLHAIPGIGDFFVVVLSFAPFLINVGALLLCVLSLMVLFFVTPSAAYKRRDPLALARMLVVRIGSDPFAHLAMLLIATLPLAAVIAVLVGAAKLTGSAFPTEPEALYVILQWFFIMLPFTALLSPAVVFFFNFAAEVHVMARKQERANGDT